MTIDALLERPSAEGVRRRALVLLEVTLAAAPRLGDPGDADAVHDLRVALRRLRSLLKLHRQELGGKLDRLRKQLRKIAALTGDARDAEVQLAWLRAPARALPRSARPAVDWLAGRLEERKRAGRGQARAVADRLPRVAEKLRRRLRAYRVALDDGVPPSFAETTARRLRTEAAALAVRLAAVASPTDEELAHQARIAAKQIRYLLEPLGESRRVGPEARDAVKRLKRLQDVLGELHDVHVFGHELEGFAEAADRRLAAGLAAVSAVVGRRRDELHAELVATRDHLPDLAALADRIAPPPARRFLLSAVPAIEGGEPLEVEEGWLPAERLRLERAADGRERPLAATGGIEVPCDDALFRGLWPFTEGRRTRWRRLRIVDGTGASWIDELGGPEPRIVATIAGDATPAWLESLRIREDGDG
jgi:CHAD domain-containing protein